MSHFLSPVLNPYICYFWYYHVHVIIKTFVHEVLKSNTEIYSSYKQGYLSDLNRVTLNSSEFYKSREIWLIYLQPMMVLFAKNCESSHISIDNCTSFVVFRKICLNEYFGSGALSGKMLEIGLLKICWGLFVSISSLCVGLS